MGLLWEGRVNDGGESQTAASRAQGEVLGPPGGQAWSAHHWESSGEGLKPVHPPHPHL